MTALLVLFAASANAYTIPFDSSGWVDPNFGNSWNPATLTGIARYYFYFDDPLVKVNQLSLQFEDDIFNLAQLDVGDFTMVVPHSWTHTLISMPGGFEWLLSGGSFINTTQDPIIVDVNYALLSANRYLYGNSQHAGEPLPIIWAWNEAQGANTPWVQKYVLNGEYQFGGSWLDAASGGSTAPIPEPSSLMLLGTGLFGLIGYGKLRLAKKV